MRNSKSFIRGNLPKYSQMDSMRILSQLNRSKQMRTFRHSEISQIPLDPFYNKCPKKYNTNFLAKQKDRIYTIQDQHFSLPKNKIEKQIQLSLLKRQTQNIYLREKPQINKTSKHIYEKYKKERQLASNVFQRLKNDQQNRSKIRLLKEFSKKNIVVNNGKNQKKDVSPLLKDKSLKNIIINYNTNVQIR